MVRIRSKKLLAVCAIFLFRNINIIMKCKTLTCCSRYKSQCVIHNNSHRLFHDPDVTTLKTSMCNHHSDRGWLSIEVDQLSQQSNRLTLQCGQWNSGQKSQQSNRLMLQCRQWKSGYKYQLCNRLMLQRRHRRGHMNECDCWLYWSNH